MNTRQQYLFDLYSFFLVVAVILLGLSNYVQHKRIDYLWSHVRTLETQLMPNGYVDHKHVIPGKYPVEYKP